MSFENEPSDTTWSSAPCECAVSIMLVGGGSVSNHRCWMASSAI